MKFKFPLTTNTVCTDSGKKPTTTLAIKPSISSLLLANLFKSGVTLVLLTSTVFQYKFSGEKMKVTGCSCFQGCAGLLCSFSQKFNLAKINDLINYTADFSFMLI